MIQNLAIIFWHLPNFLPIMLVLCFVQMHYADNSAIFIIVYLCRKMIMIGMEYELQEQVNIKAS